MSQRAPELPASHRLVHLAETTSTNAEAMRLALAGEHGPLWVMADRQTGGRGRSGRSWASLPGNLNASLLLTAPCDIAKAAQLSLLAGVAAVDAIRAAGTLAPAAELRLKWPNDILIGTAKMGGILIETTSAPAPAPPAAGAGSSSVLSVVIGIGLNLAAAPQDLGRAATYLAAHGLPLSPGDALCFLAGAMQKWLEIWAAGTGFEQIRQAWLQRAGAAGEPLLVQAREGPVEGRFVGIDSGGALLIAGNDGLERRFTFGDVSLTQGDDTGR